MKQFILHTIKFAIQTLLAGGIGVAVYFALLPHLSVWTLTSRITWPGFASKNGTTVIERTEQVVLTQEEGLERFTAAPRSAVVNLVSAPTKRTNRLFAREEIQEQSGILITNDGLVAVYDNDPPITEERRFTVFFADGNISQAQFVTYDPVVNVAYFRTDRTDTPAIAFANSKDVYQGRRFMALVGTGDPDAGKLTAGYIGENARTFNLSGKTVASTDEWEGVFLPDRPLGPSFVGGAAVALNGELIGLIGNVFIDGADQSFILPANALRQSLQRVISAANPSTSFGAYYVSLTQLNTIVYGSGRDRGALIYTPSERASLAVISGSPAEQAGLRYGDIVTAVNGREVNPDWPLSVALYDVSSGSVVTLTVLRAGTEVTMSLTR